MTKKEMIQKIESAKKAVRYTTWTDKAGYHVKAWVETYTLSDEGAYFCGVLFPYNEILDVEQRPSFSRRTILVVMFKTGAEHNIEMYYGL